MSNTGERETFLEDSIDTESLMNNPKVIFDIMEKFKPYDMVVAPSGFGHPIKKIQEIDNNDIFEMTLRYEKSSPTMGLGIILNDFKKTSYNAVIIPSIKHLPTIKESKLINKVDLGTADKLCVAVVGIRDIMENHSIPETDVNTIIIELGSAFNSIIAIRKGKIVDGIGGSNIIGFESGGAIDGEIGYLLKKITKKKIYHSGIEAIKNMTNDEELANEILIDSIIKGVYSLLVNFGTRDNPQDYQIQNILLSGRMTNNSIIMEKLTAKLKWIAPIRKMMTYSNKVKRAAQGAAFIAEGLLGGPLEPIIDNLQIKKAHRHILDHIYYQDIVNLKTSKKRE